MILCMNGTGTTSSKVQTFIRRYVMTRIYGVNVGFSNKRWGREINVMCKEIDTQAGCIPLLILAMMSFCLYHVSAYQEHCGRLKGRYLPVSVEVSPA